MVKSTFKNLFEEYLKQKMEYPLAEESYNLSKLGDNLRRNGSSFHSEISSENFVYNLNKSQNGINCFKGRTTSKDKSLKGFYYSDENGSFTLYNSAKLSNPREFFTNVGLAHQLDSRGKYLSRKTIVEINNHILLEVYELVLVSPDSDKKIVGKRIIHYDFHHFANNVQSFISNAMYKDSFGGMEVIYDSAGNVKDAEIIGEYKIGRFDQTKISKESVLENFDIVEAKIIDASGNKIHQAAPSLKVK